MSEVDRELLLSVTGGLGGLVGDDDGKPVYCKDEDCLACLKDLQRFLRNDDPKTREALQILGQYNIAKTDLVPLIVTYPQDTDLVYNALKLVTRLTMPITADSAVVHVTHKDICLPLLTCAPLHPAVKVVTFLTMPIAADSNSAPTQALYMQQVKEAFLAQDAMTVIVGLVAEPLGRHPRMSEADGFIVQLVITFIRNLLNIPDRAATAGSAGDHKSHLRQKLLMRLFEDHVMELLAVMAQYTDARPFRSEAPLLLDIFSDIFKGADAGQLAAACLPQPRAAAQENVAPEAGRGERRQPVRPRPKGFGATAERAFLAKERRALSSLGNRGAPRHARFGGMFVRRHRDEARSTYLRNNPSKSSLGSLPTPALRSRSQVSLRGDQKRDKAEAAAHACSEVQTGRTCVKVEPVPSAELASSANDEPAALAARTLSHLRAYAEQFLEAGYDVLMEVIRKDLEPGLHISRLGRQDFAQFFRLARTMTAFVRIKQETAAVERRQLQQEKQRQGHTVDTDATSKAVAEQQPGLAEADGGGPSPDKEQNGASPYASISATLGWETFHMVHTLWLGLMELPVKAPDKDWDMQHLSLGLLKEMLLALDLAQALGTSADRKAADRLQRRLFHDDLRESGLLPVTARAIKNFSGRTQPATHAQDLVQTVHVILRMLERLNASACSHYYPSQLKTASEPQTLTTGAAASCSKCPSPGTAEAGGFLVKQKARQQKPRQTKPAPPEQHDAPEGDGESGTPNKDAPGGDAGLPLAARLLSKDGPNEARAKEGTPPSSTSPAASPASLAAGTPGGGKHNPFEEADAEEAQHEARRRFREGALNLNHRIRQELAFPAVVHFYTWLLRGYATNTAFLNHCLAAYFRRIADPKGLNLEPMLYQLSVLRVFQAILADSSFRRQTGARELVQTCTGITRNLFARLVPRLPEIEESEDDDGEEADSERCKRRAARRIEKNKRMVEEGAAQMMFIELLFWKSAATSEEVGQRYNWLEIHAKQQLSKSRAAGLGDDEYEGFLELHAMLPKKKGRFSDEQASSGAAAVCMSRLPKNKQALENCSGKQL
eukprot:jgi/Astpho2/8793/Aster-05348